MGNIRLGNCSEKTEAQIYEYMQLVHMQPSLATSIVNSAVTQVKAGYCSWEEAMTQAVLHLALSCDRLQGMATKRVAMESPSVVIKCPHPGHVLGDTNSAIHSPGKEHD